MTKKIHINKRILFRTAGFCLLGILFALSAAATAMKEDSTIQQEGDNPYMTKEFDISGSGLLKIFTIAGNIEIVPSSSANKVKVELYLDRGFAFWSNTKNLDNFRITMLQRGNEIVASVEQKKRETSFFSDQMTFSFRVYVPESMSTELKTLGGNIDLRNVHGNQSIKTSGGNITLTDIKGHLQAYTAGGNIDITDSRGTIYAITDGGNISLDRNSGEIRLKTNGGRIISERISGSMLAKVGGGDIRADFISVGEGIDLETSAGNIHLEVPGHVGYELLLRGTEIQFAETDQVHGEVRGGRIEGMYKDGGPPINLNTNAGTVTLRIR